jgi:hypothetical protein
VTAVVTPRRVLISLLAAAAVVGIGWAFSNSEPDSEVRFVTGVQSVFPPPGDLDLRQVRITADLSPGFTGVLQIDGVEVPEDQLERIEALNQVSYTPGEGKEVERLSPGSHCATVVFWRIAESRDRSRRHEWCFDVH